MAPAHRDNHQQLIHRQPTGTVVLPYLGKTSHRLHRMLTQANFKVGHPSSKKLHSILHSHKDKNTPNKQPGVYKIPCDCGKVYIGETGRNFDTRLKERKSCQRPSDWDKSAIVMHAQQEDHCIDWADSKVVTNIKHWHTRRVREAIEIQRHNTVPQNTGLHLNNIWHPVLHLGTNPSPSTYATLTWTTMPATLPTTKPTTPLTTQAAASPT
ncbi:uncharacterized protein LOC135155834 [Lytechinus pictus]|uniref:uncharacterized protein LOC135155834 n=1 Tax=Lytechinus pictus TaxID=7653 RepID=UPI0030BA212D